MWGWAHGEVGHEQHPGCHSSAVPPRVVRTAGYTSQRPARGRGAAGLEWSRSRTGRQRRACKRRSRLLWFCNHLFFAFAHLSCRDFSWSPGGNIIAFWVPEDKDIPARVTLMQLPTRQEIRVRNLFNVVDCKLHWQKNGDYLCVKVDRTPKGTQVSSCHGNHFN